MRCTPTSLPCPAPLSALLGKGSPLSTTGRGAAPTRSLSSRPSLMGTLGQSKSAEAVGPPPSCFPFLCFLSSFFSVCLSVSLSPLSLCLSESLCLSSLFSCLSLCSCLCLHLSYFSVSVLVSPCSLLCLCVSLFPLCFSLSLSLQICPLEVRGSWASVVWQDGRTDQWGG